jgi:hypothetical protein
MNTQAIRGLGTVNAITAPNGGTAAARRVAVPAEGKLRLAAVGAVAVCYKVGSSSVDLTAIADADGFVVPGADPETIFVKLDPSGTPATHVSFWATADTSDLFYGRVK